jgi:nucleoside-diphosphate-sugar epimerase
MIDLRGRSVLVAGGAGFVGSALVRELIDDGARVVVLDNFLHGTLENLREIRDRVEIVSGDVLDCWRLSETFRQFGIEYVFNCVGDTYVPAAYDVPRRFFEINVEGNLNLLTASKQFGVKRMLYVSSTEVYGEATTDKVSEESLLAPLNTYAVSKTASDRLCFTFHKEHGTPVVIARIFNTYGPRETEPYVIPEIITQLDKGNVVELGNIKAERDFNYVHDTARWLIDLLRSDVPDGEAVNVGSGRVYSIEWLTHTIARIMGVKDVEIVQAPSRIRRMDIERFCCDNSRLKKYIDATPTVEIEEGLQRTVDWFRSHGRRWSWETFVDGTAVLR